jgi:hypothetical protein
VSLSNLGHSTIRLLHYWWPLALGWSTALVIHRATARPGDPAGLLVLLLGIGAAYSLDRVLDAPRSHRTWMTCALIFVGTACAAACARLLRELPLQTAALVPVLGGAALLYPRMKRMPWFKAVAVPVIWTWSAVALPFNDGSWLGWTWVLLPVSIPIALLIAAGCLLCDLKDETTDRDKGVASLPALIGASRTAQVALGLAVLAGVVAIVEDRTGLALSASALGLMTLWPAVLATESIGPLIVDAILTIPGVLIVTRVV